MPLATSLGRMRNAACLPSVMIGWSPSSNGWVADQRHARLASGNESRQARRRVPRRWLTYKVGNARQTDALVADWLADHLGQMALWPAAAVRGAPDRVLRTWRTGSM